MDSELLEQRVKDVSAQMERLLAVMSQRIVGHRHVTERLLIGLIAEGHVLLEGMPGLAKTTAVKALGESSDLRVSRIQFTPDLLPADVVGTQIYDPKQGEFKVKRGPIFANLVIADEINRAPAKVQSALLEAMQERQVTLGDETYHLEEPFLVMATQNPVEQEGTYPLPEAQTDRFLFKVRVNYNTPEEEVEIISRMVQRQQPTLPKVLTREQILDARRLVDEIRVSEKIRRYIVDLVFATREPQKYGLNEMARWIQFGASPRASINLEKSARVLAIMAGRTFVTPQDIKDVALDVMRHRIVMTYEAEADEISSDTAVQKILDRIDVP